MKARGNTRKLLIALGQVQDAVGQARTVARNDRDPDQLAHLLEALERASNLCVEARSLYDPTDAYLARAEGSN